MGVFMDVNTNDNRVHIGDSPTPICRLERRLDHLLPQIRFGEVNVLEGRLFLFVSHQLLQRGKTHMLIRFVGSKGVPEGMNLLD
jgi:hypothetical protein